MPDPSLRSESPYSNGIRKNSAGAGSRRLRILVYRIGQLGDTLVALPAFHAIRKLHPAAEITLLSDQAVGPKGIGAPQLLSNTGLVDHFVTYLVPRSGSFLLLRRFFDSLGLWWKLRKNKYDLAFYLAPSHRPPTSVRRDSLIFRSLGISRLFGFGITSSNPLPTNISEADFLLERLRADGVSVPALGQGDMSLRVLDEELAGYREWATTNKFPHDRIWVAIGAGSKMPSKQWPVERYAAVAKELFRRYRIVPIVVGSSDERGLGDHIIREVGSGLNACGDLNIKESLVALGKCLFYLGNDTGTMHLAACAKRPCIAVFSYRARKDSWFPYGVPHRVLRHDVHCKGCELVVCVEHANRCLTEISSDQVLAACDDLIQSLALIPKR